jgi:hypothetical protein
VEEVGAMQTQDQQGTPSGAGLMEVDDHGRNHDPPDPFMHFEEVSPQGYVSLAIHVQGDLSAVFEQKDLILSISNAYGIPIEFLLEEGIKAMKEKFFDTELNSSVEFIRLILLKEKALQLLQTGWQETILLVNPPEWCWQLQSSKWLEW